MLNYNYNRRKVGDKCDETNSEMTETDHDDVVGTRTPSTTAGCWQSAVAVVASGSTHHRRGSWSSSTSHLLHNTSHYIHAIRATKRLVSRLTATMIDFNASKRSNSNDNMST